MIVRDPADETADILRDVDEFFHVRFPSFPMALLFSRYTRPEAHHNTVYVHVITACFGS